MTLAPHILAEQLRPLVAVYCRRPAVRHELGLDELTRLEARVLVAGPYNLTYVVEAEEGRKVARRWVARFTPGSELGLSSSKQVAYEARALRWIEATRIAPEVCYVDATLYHLPFGFMIREYVEGSTLDYRRREHLVGAARALAKLHSLPVPPDQPFIRDDEPLRANVADAERGIALYATSPIANPRVVQILRRALAAAQQAVVHEARFAPKCLIHTNVQDSNWIVGTASTLQIAGLTASAARPLSVKLVGWEKPLLGDPSYDLAYFIAPTTTRWHGNYVLGDGEQAQFLGAYMAARSSIDADDLRERVAILLPFVSLRSITQRAAYLAAIASAGDAYIEAGTLDHMLTYLDPEWLHQLFHYASSS